MKKQEGNRIFALGSAQWGLDYGIANKQGRPSDGDIRSLLARAKQAGITSIDTASAYGCAEAVLATCQAPTEFRVITKLEPVLLRPSQVGESIRLSLSRLDLKVLDTVLFHRGPDSYPNGDKLWRCLCEAKEDGIVKRIGVSAANPAQAWRALELEGLDTVQVASSLLDRRLYSEGFFDSASQRRKEVFVRSVYIQGLAHLSPESLPGTTSAFAGALNQLDALAADVGIERWQIFLSWARQRLEGTVILGQESRSQLEANLQAWKLPVSDDILREAEAAAALADDAPLDPSTWNL